MHINVFPPLKTGQFKLDSPRNIVFNLFIIYLLVLVEADLTCSSIHCWFIFCFYVDDTSAVLI